MTATELIAKVAEIVQDTSFSSADILGLINEGIWEIASDEGNGDSDRGVYLPSLRTSGTVSATSAANSVALPVNYLKGLYHVASASQGCRVGGGKSDYYNLHLMLEKFPLLDQVGNITHVCVDGANLLYQGKATDTLTLRYYKQPTALLEPTVPATVGAYTTPTELPTHLHVPLLVSYCCKEIFAIIEDGIEGKKANTDYWSSQFARAMAKLKKYIDLNEPREAVFVRDAG